MPTSTRLDRETLALLQEAAQHLGLRKSEVIRKSIREYCSRVVQEKRKTPWEIYHEVHSPGGSGHGKRILMGKEILRKQLEAKRKKWSS